MSLSYRLVRDLTEAGRLWQAAFAPRRLADLWPVRLCFQKYFNRPPLFIAAEEKGRLNGLLPLSWIEERQAYGYFPGETWAGRTWLEQNRVLAARPEVLSGLLEACPGPWDLRYLNPEDGWADWAPLEVDELNYHFNPSVYDYDFETFNRSIPGKKRRKLESELRNLSSRSAIEWRYNHLPDVQVLLEMNQQAFGDLSYFRDSRFKSGFLELTRWLHGRGMLRLVSLLMDGSPAAVDLGGLFNGDFCLLAGGVDPEHRCAAKMINLHHLLYACQAKLETVDFLCGDFNWKARFGLEARPLYMMGSHNFAYNLTAEQSGLRAA